MIKRTFERIILYLFTKGKILYFENLYSQFKFKYHLPDSFRFNGENIKFYGEGKIIAGNNSYIGESSTIQAFEGTKIVIGDNCRISHNVRFYSCSNDPDSDFNDPQKEIVLKKGDIIVGNGTWIGANVMINPGVIIGKNVVIGANSVVTSNIEDDTIVGGVPARKIRTKIA